MFPAELLALASLALTLIFRPAASGVMLVFVAAWMGSPFIPNCISTLRPPERKVMSFADIQLAQRIARRTWRFFETFVGAEDNWLPPDNYQEDPSPVVAHRTSPTNMGLLLLGNHSARDLGYLGALELLERQELTFATLEKLG